MRRQDAHHDRRHDAARGRRQGRRRRHHGDGRAPGGASRDSARADPHLLHLRRGDRPRRRSRRPEEARRRRRLHARRRRPRARSTPRRSPPTWPIVTDSRRQHPPVDRQGTDGQRHPPGRPVPRPPAADDAVAGDDRRPRGLPAPLPDRRRRRRDADPHPAARLRHRQARRRGRAAAHGRPDDRSRVSAARRST